MLKATALTKKFGDFTALDHLDLHVGEGEVFCLLGGNGAGKSTTINLFLSFIEPTSGQATIAGMDVHQHPQETKANLAYIPENLMLYPNLTGLENLGFFCGLTGKKYTREQLASFLIEAGLQQNFIGKKVKNYSKGMRQKVGVALANAKQAKVMLLDEPTSGLDPKASNEFSEHLKQLKEQGIAVLMATHDLFRAKDTGTHIGIMRSGKLVEHFQTTDITFHDLEKLYINHMSR